MEKNSNPRLCTRPRSFLGRQAIATASRPLQQGRGSDSLPSPFLDRQRRTLNICDETPLPLKPNGTPYRSRYYALNRERHKQTVKRWNDQHPGYWQAYRLARKERLNADMRRYHSRHAVRCRARSLLFRAVRRGLVKKLPCFVCGTQADLQAHHPDYRKPLEVVWYCRRHHHDLHIKQRKQEPHMTIKVTEAEIKKAIVKSLKNDPRVKGKPVQVEFDEIELGQFGAVVRVKK